MSAAVMQDPPGLHTARLTLRAFVHADAQYVVQLLNEPSFHRFIGDRGVRTPADAQRYLERGPLESYRVHGFGLMLISVRETGAPIGMAGIMWREWLDAPDVAYALSSDAEGHGYGTEAARAVMEYARATLHIHHVVAIVNPDNAASVRVLGKLGFMPDGTVRDPQTDAELLLFRNVPAPPTDSPIARATAR